MTSDIGLDPSRVTRSLSGGPTPLPVQDRNRFLDGVERFGNALPDPALIFVGLIALLMAISAVGAAAAWSAVNPVTGETLIVKSLLSEQSLQLLITEIPRTYAAFAPLGIALTIMLGAGVADRSGLFVALVRIGLGAIPEWALVPAVLLAGMLTCHAFDAGYIVFVPLAGLMFAAAGRHPVLGLTVGFAGACVGLAGNLLPGQYDVLILSITETGARLIEPGWTIIPWATGGSASESPPCSLGWVGSSRPVLSLRGSEPGTVNVRPRRNGTAPSSRRRNDVASEEQR